MTGSSKQTTTTNSAPWSGAQPALNTALTSAENLYNSGNLSYGGNTVIPWDTLTQQGMNSVEANAKNNGINSQYWQTNQNALNNGGLSQEQLSSMRGYQNIADQGGYNDALRKAQGAYQGMLDSGGYNSAQNEALGNVRSLANSTYAISPELQKVLDANASQMGDQVNLATSGAGRYGSGAHTDVLSKNVGNQANQTILSDYNNYLGRRDAANSNLFSMGQTGQGNVSNAASGIAGIGNSAMSNQMGAYGNMSNLSQQGFNNLGTAYSNLNAPYKDLMNIGSMNEDLASRNKNEELRQFNAPKSDIEWLMGIGSGAGSLGGTKTQSSPGQNPYLTALGYGTSGLGLLGSLF